MRIFLVRHGESLGNVDKTTHASMADHAIPLSDKGIKEAQVSAEVLTQFLKDAYTWELEKYPQLNQREAPKIKVWSSPYKRTRQTAEKFVSNLEMNFAALKYQEHVLLCEQQFGLFDGIPDEQLPEIYPEEQAHYAKCEQFEGRFWARMPLGESRFDVAARIHQCFDEFKKDVKNGYTDLVVVCHGVSLRAFVMMWCGKEFEWFDREQNPKNCSIRLIEGNHDRGYLYIPGDI